MRIAVGLALIAALVPLVADAAEPIEFGEPYFHSANLVIHHEVGSPTSYYHVLRRNERGLETDIGYAVSTSRNDAFRLHAYARVDSTEIDGLGLDYVIAEGTNIFRVDFVVNGPEATAELELDVTIEDAFEIDEAEEGGVSLHGIGQFRILDADRNHVAGGLNPGVQRIEVATGVSHELQLLLTSYAQARLGSVAEHERSLSLDLHVVGDLATPACSDGEDGDGDGFIDLDDPGCDDAADHSERSQDLLCDNGLDEEWDGGGDFPADLGCLHPAAPREATECDDDRDNDGDGAIDWDGGRSGQPDPECLGPLHPETVRHGCSDAPVGALAGLPVFAAWAWRRRR